MLKAVTGVVPTNTTTDSLPAALTNLIVLAIPLPLPIQLKDYVICDRGTGRCVRDCANKFRINVGHCLYTTDPNEILTVCVL